MWMEKMCGADAIIALINHGLDFKRRDPKTGQTVLNYVAFLTQYIPEEDKLELVKLLVDKGADVMARNNQGLTPLLAAANADYPNFTVVNYLLERDEYCRMEKIEAIELIGATILLNFKNTFTHSINGTFPKAFEYWRRAHQLREMEKEVSGSSADKILCQKIGRNVEWTTLAELNELEQNLKTYKIQALMVKLRITFSICQEAARCIYCQYLFKHFPLQLNMNNEEKISQILKIRWGMFDQTIRRLDHLSSNDSLWHTLLENVYELVIILSTLQINHSTLFNFETIKTTLDLFLLAITPSVFSVTCADESTQSISKNYFGAQFSNCLFDLLEMISCYLEIPNVHHKASLTEPLRQLGHYRLGILLLQSCERLFYCKSLAVVRLLLDARADPNVIVSTELHRNHGKTSLHVVAGMSDRKLGDAAGLLLVEFGAKLYQDNKAGKSALDTWVELNEKEDYRIEMVDKRSSSARPEWCCPLPTLLCLAARVIRIHRIPHADGETPTALYPLIGLHNLR